MNSLALLVATLVVTMCGAWTKHYSFTNGFPSNEEVNLNLTKAMENGGARMTTSVQMRPRVVNAEKSIIGRVTKVIDGDTIMVTPNGGRGKRVRMRRIDAPEADQPGGKEAMAFLDELIGGKEVNVKYAQYDDYGRILGTVFVKSKGADGGKAENLMDANLTMVLNGWAWHCYFLKANDKIPAYDKAEQAARNAKIGLWADDNPIRPYDWRKRK